MFSSDRKRLTTLTLLSLLLLFLGFASCYTNHESSVTTPSFFGANHQPYLHFKDPSDLCLFILFIPS